VLTRAGTQWQIDLLAGQAGGQPADSARVIDFLNTLNIVQSVNFVDDVQIGQAPVYVLQLKPAGLGEAVAIEAFEVGGEHGYLIRSSLNPNSYFSESQSQLMNKLYIRSSLFYPAIEE